MGSLAPALDRALEHWSTAPTTIVDHEERCCAAAREWLVGSDRARGGQRGGCARLDWPRRRWEWGPVRHPLHWCELDSLGELDCGSFAALSVFLVQQRRLEAIPVQLVQWFPPENTRHWRRRWLKRKLDTIWITDTHVYHEACGIVRPDGTMRIWDPTDAVWLGAAQRHGYAATVAARVPSLRGRSVLWGEHRLSDEWTDVAR